VEALERKAQSAKRKAQSVEALERWSVKRKAWKRGSVGAGLVVLLPAPLFV
jgi:hypothetical protein